MIIVATFRLEDPTVDEAIHFWNDCLLLARSRGWTTQASHAQYITPPAVDT